MPVSVSAVTDESDAGIIQIYQEADHYMVKRIRNSSVSAKFPFELNHPGQTKLPDGRTVSVTLVKLFFCIHIVTRLKISRVNDCL